jgi:Tfp pilus assembly PilM family ATPase
MATQVAHQLLDAGLSCQVLDGGPFALARAIQLANTSSSKATVGVMDWGGDILNFTIMVNGEPAFTRVIHDCGMRKFVDAIRAGLDLPAEECHEILATHGIPHPQDNILNVSEVQEIVSELLAEPLNRLISEMEKTNSFLTNQRPELIPSEIWLVGGGAAIRNGDARLTSAMHLPVRRWKMPRVERSPLIHEEVPVELFAQAAALSQLGFES